MTLDDIPAVVALEGRAMNEGWHPGAYAHELEHNGAARYLVAEILPANPGDEASHPAGDEASHHAGEESCHHTGEEVSHHTGEESSHHTGEESSHHTGEELRHTDRGAIAGFAGLWLQFDQAHVVTVAVEPAMQRNGIGSLLVLSLFNVAEEAGMEDATLEVRTSNVAARSLYRGFGFFEVGVRKKYYLDNGEDAVIMTTEAITSEAFKRRVTKLRAEISARFDLRG